MPIQELDVGGYRSLRQLTLRLGRVNLITGPNGCGKSNLYRSLSLVAEAARGSLSEALAVEGGMPSVLFAGTVNQSGPVRLRLRVALDELSYELECGLPSPSHSLFSLDPLVKKELVWHGQRRPGTTLLERRDTTTWVRDGDFNRTAYPRALQPNESVLSQISEPHLYPELSLLRTTLVNWRFYHHFRTDAASPLRSPQVGVHSPVLSNDGSNLVAALQTIVEIGDARRLHRAFEMGFPGASFRIERTGFALQLLTSMPGVSRHLTLTELSDGTLRFLCLMAVLLSPRPPELLALNEPETSLHPDLLAPLAELLASAAEHSQLWVTTHSPRLAELVAHATGESPIELKMIDGETRIPSHSVLGERLDEDA